MDVMWKLYLAHRFFGHGTVASLRRELNRNPSLRRVCGLENCKGKNTVSSDRVFTNFKKLLIDCRDERMNIFNHICMRTYRISVKK
ncbi:transposase [Clostridium sp. C45]|uniref:transposase n=1 Tax=Clostridium TaxID=1485 RepID=UPI0037C0B59A